MAAATLQTKCDSLNDRDRDCLYSRVFDTLRPKGAEILKTSQS
ncbi:hypothetical protein PN499_13290 [Kamptonema animale CS-326]|nr:hypothetical protein [Kamptonema animale]MDB9512161.1 hypothetical protein [Kamptonema animale CS-326]